MSSNKITLKQLQEESRNKLISRYVERTRLTIDDYYKDEFEEGLKWIEHNAMTEKIAYTKAFWDWWKVHFEVYQGVIMNCMDEKLWTLETYRTISYNHRNTEIPKTLITKNQEIS